MGGRKAQEGGDVYLQIDDSLHCTAETNTTLQSNYTSIKMFKKKKRVPCESNFVQKLPAQAELDLIGRLVFLAKEMVSLNPQLSHSAVSQKTEQKFGIFLHVFDNYIMMLITIISQSFLICKLDIMVHRVLMRTKYEECQDSNQHKKAFLIIAAGDGIATFM